MTKLAVLGSPIAHSKSPLLHVAAYRALGLDWSYEPIEVTGETLPGFVRSRNSSWRGLSLTMPLKRDILPLLDSRDELVEQTGSANTVLFAELGGKRWVQGANTDVYGITQSFQRAGHSQLDTVHILGGGATAASAVVAAARLGAQTVYVSVRDAAKALPLTDVGASCGVEVVVGPLSDVASVSATAIISTLPNGAQAALDFSEETRRSTVLFDVAYDPWPTPLAASWIGPVIPGIEMLINQALIQVRVFVNGNPESTVTGEPAVLEAMRAAVA